MAQIASGYKVSEANLEYLIEVQGREKSTRLSLSDLLMTKLGSGDPEKFKIFAVGDLPDTDCQRPIVEYVKNPTGSTN